MPVYLHTFQRENTYSKLHENAPFEMPFEMKNYKNFLGMGTFQITQVRQLYV